MTLSLFLLFAALVGHLVLWLGIFNRVHAIPLSRKAVKALDKVIYLAAAGLPAWFLWPHAGSFFQGAAPNLAPAPSAAFAWLAICWVAAGSGAANWIVRRLWPLACAALVSDRFQAISLEERLGERPVAGLPTRLLAAVPGNQILTLHIHEKTLALPGLPDALEGLTIAHLSDLHFTGGLTRRFFEQVVDETNALECEFVALTGDILDTAKCLPWIPHTVGRLQARCGVFFVLGNHDKRLRDVPGLRRMLVECGLTDLGGHWTTRSFRDEPILFAGTEVPWFGAAPDLTSAPPPRREGGPCRIALSHSPDQIRWARRHQFDLMLAGHTHGGQVRLPVVGPLVAPSIYGVKYASGVFDEPPTVMHVSRGVSGLQPLRINCPPELTRIILCRAEADSRPPGQAALLAIQE